MMLENDIIEPAAIPEQILKRKESINLYMVAVVALAAIAILPIVGSILLSFFDKQMAGEIWLAVGSAVSALAFVLGYNAATR